MPRSRRRRVRTCGFGRAQRFARSRYPGKHLDAWDRIVGICGWSERLLCCSIYVLTVADTVRGYVYDSGTALGNGGARPTDRLVVELWATSTQDAATSANCLSITMVRPTWSPLAQWTPGAGGSRAPRGRGPRHRSRAATRARLTFHSSSPRLWIATEFSALSEVFFHRIRPPGPRTCVPLCPRLPVFHSHVPFGRDLCTHG